MREVGHDGDAKPAATPLVYEETFDDGPGGWFGFVDNFKGEKPLRVRDGVLASFSPWWVDYNHAPPAGAGYLQLLMGFNTRGPFSERISEITGANAFDRGKFPTDFVNARFTFRIRGEMERRGAELLLLVQGRVGDICSGWMLVGQPIRVTQEWSEQTITAVLDAQQWKCLGTRPDRADMYGAIALESILRNVNVNIYLVTYPLNVVPMGPVHGDPARLRAGRDYPLWQSKLPEGYVMLDTFRIEFANSAHGANGADDGNSRVTT
jgi:hypothetical protein